MGQRINYKSLFAQHGWELRAKVPAAGTVIFRVKDRTGNRITIVAHCAMKYQTRDINRMLNNALVLEWGIAAHVASFYRYLINASQSATT